MKGKELLKTLKESLGEDLQGEHYGDAEAVIGVDYHTCKLIFSVRKSIELLMERDGMEYEVAKEYIHYNYIGARGQDEPIWLDDDSFEV
jgi:hypothetical protein